MKIIGFLVFLISLVSEAQTSDKADSLKNLIPLSSPEKQLDLYTKIGMHFQANNFDSALYYFSKAKDISVELTMQYKTNELYKLIGTVYFRKGNYEQSKVEYEKAMDGYIKTNDMVGQAKIVNNLSMLLQSQGKNQEAINNLEKALKTFTESGNEELQTLPLTNLGIIYFHSGNYPMATEKFNQALLIANKYNDLPNISNITNNLGTVYKEQGKYSEALECFNQSVLSYQAMGDKFAESASCNNIGILYKELGIFKQALFYVNKSLQIKREIQALDKIPASLLIIGDIYCEWQKYEPAIDSYYEALELSKESENLSDQAEALNGLAKVYLKTDLYPKAVDLLTEASKIFEALDYKKELAQTYNNLAVVYSTKLNNITKANQLFNKVEKLYSNIGSTVGLSELEYNKGQHFYHLGLWRDAISSFEKSNQLMPYSLYHLYETNILLGQCYQNTGNLNASIMAYRKALQYKDSVTNDKLDLQTVQIELELYVQKKEHTIDSLSQQNKLITLQINKNKNMHYLYMTSLLLLSILVVIFLYFTFRLKKINYQLHKQQLKIESQNKYLEEANNRLTETKNEAIKNSDFKSQFLANISHEIRTPLNAIIGYTKLLDKNLQTEYNSNYLNNIILASNNLSVIINDLLDFSKIEDGKMILNQVSFHPNELIKQAVSTIKYRAEEKNIKCTVNIDPAMPATLIGDPYLLSQIMINLINNALKFSNNNQIVTIDAKCRIECQKCQLIFSVTDNGIGIEADQLETIFESFNQAKSDTARMSGGTGLGLAIVKRLVTLQGGTIEVKSKKNEGSTFTISICYEISQTPIIENSTKYKNKPLEMELGSEIFNILLVEDNLINQELAVDTIKSWKLPFTVDIAENGKEAITALNNKKYHVILMDIQMPVMDGHEATRFIRNEMPEPISSIPIIGITAHALTSEKEMALKDGMNEYITKPFNPEELKQKIAFFVRM